MTSFINVPPPNRGPSIGERIGAGFGEGFGEAMQQASSSYLQGKISQMFANQERDRIRPSALALAKTLNIPVDQQQDLAEMFIDNPTLATQAFVHRPSNMSVDDRLGLPTRTNNFSQPSAPQQMNMQMNQAPPSSLTAPRMPGIPEQGYLPMIEQQYQKAQEQAPYQAQLQAQAARNEEQAGRSPFPEVPTEQSMQVPQQEEIGIDIPPIFEKPDPEHYRRLRAQATTDTEQKNIDALYNARNDRYLKSVQAHNDAVDKQSRLEERRQKAGAKTKSDEKFLEEASGAVKRSEDLTNALDTMESLVKGGNVGIIWDPSNPQQRNDRAQMEEAQIAVDAVIRNDIMKGGNLSDARFNALLNKWTPAPGLTDATNLGRIEGLRQLTQYGLKMQKALDAIRKPDGTYPRELRARVDQYLADNKKKMKQMLLSGPESVLRNGMEVDKPPSASSFKEGEGFTDNVTHIRYVKKNGVMTPASQSQGR